MPAARNVFASLGFARVQAAHGGGDPRLLVIRRDGAVAAAWPLLLRSLPELGGELVAGLDATTPMFTGPIAPPAAPAVSAGDAGLVAAYLRELGVVASFAHLNPWHVAAAAINPATVARDREIVYVDVTRPDDELQRESFTHAARKNLRRAEREGVSVRAAESDDDIAAFHRIFALTMDRREALSSYRLGLGYFLALRDELGERARFALAEHSGRVVAATLYLHDDTEVYSYLGGQDNDHQAVRPTNAVVAATIGWARDAGKRRLVLGAGYRPDDGIMRFKASFSPLRAELELHREVIDPIAYERLAAAWSAAAPGADPGSYFPAYRAPLPEARADG